MPTSTLYPELDVLIVGAGFAGLYQLYVLRPLGLHVKIFETAPDIGGVWYWNSYPGARVDTPGESYQFSLPAIWKDWLWTEAYPSSSSMHSYFHHVDKILDLKKDIELNTRVKSAEWNAGDKKWTITTADGRIVRTKYFIICTGVNTKPHIPDYEGLDTFKGVWHHTSRWPRDGLDLEGKRIAVVGTGASGVQVSQEAAAVASKLTVFQRTANPCLPMRQCRINTCPLEREEHNKLKEDLYPIMFRRMLQTPGGLVYMNVPETTFSVTPEERRLFYEKLYAQGGVALWLWNYSDVLIDKAANAEVYAFWRKKTQARIKNPKVAEKVAPLVPPNAFGTKRISLERGYYEIFNQENVELVDLTENPIVRITENGLLTKDGIEHAVDVLVMATGFDSVTGSITAIDIKGIDGVTIRETWSKGPHTHLGVASSKFPNMFFTTGPQSPGALTNGPTCAEIQGDWLRDLIKYAEAKQIQYIEARPESEQNWRQLVAAINSMTLFAESKSWYNGANIPNKPFEPLTFIGGIPMYMQKCSEEAEQDYSGFLMA
ncbi:cyclohexanone monooxygenase [Rhodocollybia butyracea]|uniref:Cyclohexanone monooxygenase n=1 Tax=Rhodocollybia butyracea TaxID=206335 RepID=A0A9P5UDV1_9AGAR|nr:cyclohexanone monooxygenase [Rhodocollybia butyracea]